MKNTEAYHTEKINKSNHWALFLFLGWSYGSMDQIGKQIFYYLSLGGLGIWTFYRFVTLNKAIKNYNRQVAVKHGYTSEDLLKMGLI